VLAAESVVADRKGAYDKAQSELNALKSEIKRTNASIAAAEKDIEKLSESSHSSTIAFNCMSTMYFFANPPLF
jgi:peptidoglycan hydrolase CwlO-like protein